MSQRQHAETLQLLAVLLDVWFAVRLPLVKVTPMPAINLSSSYSQNFDTLTNSGSRRAAVTLAENDTASATRIRDIQGAGHTSPLVGQSATNVVGIVTAVRSNGFYIQDPNPDNNNATSEGIFVFRGSSGSKPNVGDSVQVTGRVDEFRSTGRNNDLSLTQINATVSGSSFNVENNSKH